MTFDELPILSTTDIANKLPSIICAISSFDEKILNLLPLLTTEIFGRTIDNKYIAKSGDVWNIVRPLTQQELKELYSCLSE